MRRPKAQPKRRSAPRRPRISREAWKLVIIDDAPVRKRAVAEYLRAEHALEQKRALIEQFNAADLPAYHRWEAATFGPLMAEIRAIEEQAEGKARILDAVREEMSWSGCSSVTAYQRVMRSIDAPPEPADDEDDDDAEDFDEEETPTPDDEKLFGESNLPPGFDVDNYDTLPKAGKAAFRAFYESVAELYEMMTGRSAPNLDAVLEDERASRHGHRQRPRPERPDATPSPERASHSRTPTDERIKSLYRRLVRKLHPDQNAELTPRERELWHEVQEAYQSRDLERLEAAAGRVEFGLNGASMSAPVSLLLRMTRDLRSALRAIDAELRLAKRHSAWHFSARTRDRDSIARKLRAQLESRRRTMSEHLARVTAILDDLAQRAAAPQSPRRSRAARDKRSSGSPDQMAFW